MFIVLPKSQMLLAILFSLMVLSLSNPAHAEANDKKLQLNLALDFLAQGPYSVSHDFLIGGELQYFFTQQNDWDHFVKAGYRRGLEQEGALLNLLHTDIGTRYQLPFSWNEKFYLEGSLGLVYASESFSTRLINRTINTSENDFDLKAGVGIAYDLGDKGGVSFNINRWGGNGNSLGLTYSYGF